MSIRLREVNGIKVALCAVESDQMPGDIYIDDGYHYALAAKFCRDFCEPDGKCRVEYPEIWEAMDTQKVRDAQEEMENGVRTMKFKEESRTTKRSYLNKDRTTSEVI